VSDKQQVVIKTYRGKQAAAAAAFRADAERMAAEGYSPVSQTWAQGSYGCGAFLLALLLCIIVIGILIFVYMLIVKPPGVLTVTYELRQIPRTPVPQGALEEEKTCPRCAERVKAAAQVCRFCGHEFQQRAS
jgi:hypothetical protein